MNHYNTIFYAESTWEDFDVRVSNHDSGEQRNEGRALGSDAQAEQESEALVQREDVEPAPI